MKLGEQNVFSYRAECGYGSGHIAIEHGGCRHVDARGLAGPAADAAVSPLRRCRWAAKHGWQRGAGSGLGLAICSELIEMMGGNIEIESRLGHGSTFHVRLPLTKPALPPSITPATTGADLRPLLVENEAIAATVICGLLKREGHAALRVINGLSTLAELSQASFDAMLLDLDQPGLDGFQIERRVRQREHVGHRCG